MSHMILDLRKKNQRLIFLRNWYFNLWRFSCFISLEIAIPLFRLYSRRDSLSIFVVVNAGTSMGF